jgi:hypothetical protein
VALSVSASVSAYGQINIDQLNPASVYDAGVIQDSGLGGGLDSALWQGVSAKQAIRLIENIDTNATGSARSLIRAALLSGGVPPKAEDSFEREAYIAARLSAVLALGNVSDFDTLANQADINRANPVYTKIFVERTLLGADTQTACAITDNVTIERKSPYWAKVRAFCHVVRGEIPAAELTADLLARSGHEDKNFFALLGKLTKTRLEITMDGVETPLQIAMLREAQKTENISVKSLPLIFIAKTALNEDLEQELRLAALFKTAHLMDVNQTRSLLVGYTDTPQGLAEILKKADAQGQLLVFAHALEAQTRTVPLQNQVELNTFLFARTAVLRGDTANLRGLFQLLDADDPVRRRIAFASDALNNGFVFGELGLDLETRLAGDVGVQARAVRDSYIAVAMGANLSPEAEGVLRAAKLKGRSLNPGALLALQAAARRGSKAEVALRAAHLIDGEPLRADAFAALLAVFTSVGMYEQAGRLAALDILDTE